MLTPSLPRIYVAGSLSVPPGDLLALTCIEQISATQLQRKQNKTVSIQPPLLRVPKQRESKKLLLPLSRSQHSPLTQASLSEWLKKRISDTTDSTEQLPTVPGIDGYAPSVDDGTLLMHEDFAQEVASNKAPESRRCRIVDHWNARGNREKFHQELGVALPCRGRG